MQIEKGSVVRSLCGRDKGRMFAVVGFTAENFALIADGRLRPVLKPKKKKLRHLQPVGRLDPVPDDSITNRGLWKALRVFSEHGTAAAEGGISLVQG